MLRFIALANENSINVPMSYIKNINRLERIDDFQTLDKSNRDERVLAFIHGSHNILSLFEQNSALLELDTYKDNLMSYTSIEEAYRQKVALYNSDVIGYNYWANMFSMRFLFRRFGFTQKDLIV